jgi:CMP/dCMP kinase
MNACGNCVMSDLLEVVTIDGPSGVGKSTISRMVALRLGFTYLDTGAMYRAVAFKCRQNNLAADNAAEVARILPLTDIRLLPAGPDREEVGVLLDGRDISSLIRTEEISMLASAISALKPVRERLTAMQQQIGAGGKIVAEGRDTGTIVFPGAAWKFFLDASLEERARRRINQMRERGLAVDEQEIAGRIRQRDRNDRERTFAPLAAAPDALLIDTTAITPMEVVERILAVVQNRAQ